MKKPLTAIIVGAGHRSFVYANYALNNPDQLKITGVADPNTSRRALTAKKFGFPDDKDHCFESAGALAAMPKMADAVINGTMDHQHVPTSIPLLKRGYGMLLEKPFATNEQEMRELENTARQNNSKVMICHVLRYAPFYTAIRQKILDGAIGDLINIQLNELVSYHHMAVAFVRGKWNNTNISHSTMLLAKSCHDMDILMWLKSGVKPLRIASFGGNYQFIPSKCPPGAGTRCLVDCPIEAGCLYSAKKHYIDHPDRWSFYVWDSLEHIENPTIEQKIQSLKKDNPYGRCIWKCDNNTVDHQSIIVDFEDDSTATFNMIGGASGGERNIHVVGTKGEIYGVMEQEKFYIRKIDTSPNHEYSEEIFDLKTMGDTSGAFGGHGGGDDRLVADFVNFMRDGTTSISCTSLEDSINGHLAVFRADMAREQHTVIDIKGN
ncbi:MAG: Gfo/Idh/MocA family oxidoreductase [Treponema sp.]|nr:Gfo/Idh/MocA family oxidoreductase [Treponema sp.]